MKIFSAIRFRQEWFLLLCPAFLITRGFAHFSASVQWQDALALFFEYGIWSVAISVGLSFFLPFRKAALLTTVLFLFNSVYSLVYEYSQKHQHRLFFTRFSFVFPVVLVLFFLLFFYLRKTKRNFGQLTNYLNVLFLVLIATEVFQFAIDLKKRGDAVVATMPCKRCPSPDVYLIIVDGYAGKTQLREQFKFDNTSFEDSLRLAGFHVVDSSISNYYATNVSMSSLLRMNFVEFDPDADVHAPFNPNSVVDFFKKQNYRIVNNSFFTIDQQFPQQPINVFRTGRGLLTQHTFIWQLNYVRHNLLAGIGYAGEIERLKRLGEESRKLDQGRDSVTMQNLLAAAKSRGQSPKFIYTHFIMPHGPHLFDEYGRLQKDTGTEASRYISYHRYTNKQLLFGLDGVLKLSEKPPIILLLSDHGSRIESGGASHRLRFYNLAAVYLPNRDYKPFYKGMS
ncbi:MAG TPA: sulfatase-like hydrolase/transferase, partial [Flavisolibacter sp.]|nr:sulfatase-like hydrolase/transferase [Flavisolibacter sp.]